MSRQSALPAGASLYSPAIGSFTLLQVHPPALVGFLPKLFQDTMYAVKRTVVLLIRSLCCVAVWLLLRDSSGAQGRPAILYYAYSMNALSGVFGTEPY